jgi:hypothetical protein
MWHGKENIDMNNSSASHEEPNSISSLLVFSFLVFSKPSVLDFYTAEFWQLGGALSSKGARWMGTILANTWAWEVLHSRIRKHATFFHSRQTKVRHWSGKSLTDRVCHFIFCI